MPIYVDKDSLQFTIEDLDGLPVVEIEFRGAEDGVLIQECREYSSYTYLVKDELDQMIKLLNLMRERME